MMGRLTDHAPLVSSNLNPSSHPAMNVNDLIAAFAASTSATNGSNNKMDGPSSSATVPLLPSLSTLPFAPMTPVPLPRYPPGWVAIPDLNCAFCLNTAAFNKIGRPESMVSCTDCGSSGHPTCLDYEAMLVRKIKTYPWKCELCKKCEVCVEKGEDDDMLLCDYCDRGWHRCCLNPPLAGIPRGKWTCPTCQSASTYFTALDADALPKKRLILHTSDTRPTPSPPQNSKRSKSGETPRFSRNEKGKGRARENVYGDNVTPRSGTSGSGLKLTFNLGRPLKNAASVIKSRVSSVKRQRKEDEIPYWNRVASPEPEEEEDAVEEDLDPYGGILVGADAAIDDRRPTPDDRKRWEMSREVSEAKVRALTTAYIPAAPIVVASTSTTPQISMEDFNQPLLANRPVRDRVLTAHAVTPGTPSIMSDSAPPTPGGSMALATGSVPAANIKAIRFGEFEIETWYQAPFPEEYSKVADGRLWICEFCLKYTKGEFQAGRHRLKCKTRHPPGDEIYRDGKVSVFEVDGRKNKIYCQNLCLLAKMFLDHKTLYYDVEPFLFYVMTTAEITGAKFVGYFSKEKRSPTNNVSCIMTLPVRQRKGWGNLLIDFSYLLSKKERRRGTPERPLSDLGLLSYRNYWTLVIFLYLHQVTDSHDITIQEISAATALTFDDIYFILHEQNLIIDLNAPPPPPPPLSPISLAPVIGLSDSTTTASPLLGLSLSLDDVSSAPLVTNASSTVAATPKLKNPSHKRGAALSARKRANAAFANATVAGSSSRQPHAHDPHHDSTTPELVIPSAYKIVVDRVKVAAYVQRWRSKEKYEVRLRPEQLKWTPFLVQRNYGMDIMPVLSAVGGVLNSGGSGGDAAGANVGVGGEASGSGTIREMINDGDVTLLQEEMLEQQEEDGDQAEAEEEEEEDEDEDEDEDETFDLVRGLLPLGSDDDDDDFGSEEEEDEEGDEEATGRTRRKRQRRSSRRPVRSCSSRRGSSPVALRRTTRGSGMILDDTEEEENEEDEEAEGRGARRVGSLRRSRTIVNDVKSSPRYEEDGDQDVQGGDDRDDDDEEEDVEVERFQDGLGDSIVPTK